jgi:hypothetical protein
LLVLVSFLLGLATKRVVVGLGPPIAVAGLFWVLSLRGWRLAATLGALGLGLLVLFAALGPGPGLGWPPIEGVRHRISAYAFNFPNHLRQLLDVPFGSPEVWSLIAGHQRLFFMSFWGLFGWFSRPMSADLYQVLMLATGLGALGFMLWLGWQVWQVRVLRGPQHDDARRSLQIGLVCLAAIGTMVVLAEGERLAYLSPGQIPQGRYLFDVVAAIAIVLAVGTRVLLPARTFGTVLPVAIVALSLVALDVHVYASTLAPFFRAGRPV